MDLKEEHTLSLLALHRIPGIPPDIKRNLNARFGIGVFDVPDDQLRDSGLKPQHARALHAPDWQAAHRDLTWLQGPGRRLLEINDCMYPAMLREIHDPPFLLFVEGDCALLDCVQISMVGARKPTAAGRNIARQLASELVEHGIIITSGLAGGIDSMAHEGALSGKGFTIAVLGNGPDIIYPRSNAKLTDSIRERGAIVTEHPPGTPPRKHHFPARNRIISGLSLATIVVEAAMRSGSLITARLAAEQGRDVFAVPGSVLNPVARGCHWLIKQGAKLIECADDVLGELSGELQRAKPQHDEPNAHMYRSSEPEESGNSLLQIMGFEPVTVDMLVQTSGLTAAEVSSMLLNMELSGLIESQLDGTYIRIAR